MGLPVCVVVMVRVLVPRHRFLLDAAYTESTLRRYNTAVNKFRRWMEANDEPDVGTVEELDVLVCDYLHHLYTSGAGCGKALGVCTVYGLYQRSPQLRGRLLCSELALKGWGKKKPSVSYPPVSWKLAVAVACSLGLNGYARMGIGILLSFDCMLRVSELLALRREDVADSGDVRLDSDHVGMVLILRATKTGKNKEVTVLRDDVRALVRSLVQQTPRGGRLFPFSATNYRKQFRRACDSVGVGGVGYVLHSLRHGGATDYYRRCQNIEQVMFRGRWAARKSAEVYIKSSRALLLSITISKHTAKLAARVSKHPLSSFLSACRHYQNSLSQ